MRFTVTRTGPVDERGKCQHLLEWEDPQGVFRPEISKQDNKPVGYRRAQYFRCNYHAHLESLRVFGHEVVEMPAIEGANNGQG